MILINSKLSKFILIIGVIILAVVGSYSLLCKLVVKEIPVLYKVVQVIDGDTILVKLNNQIKTVRLIGVDTPEVDHSQKSIECFGIEATKRAKELLENQMVYLIPDPLSPDQDNYGRFLRYIFLPNGLLVNAKLIKEGFGFNYIYKPFQFMKWFDALEKQAKENRSGLWSEKCNYYFEIKKE